MAGGMTQLTILTTVGSGDVLKTVILSTVGAGVSFVVTMLCRRIFKR